MEAPAVGFRDKDVNEAPAPPAAEQRTDQTLQHQALYGIEPLDWLMRRAYTKSARKLATRRDDQRAFSPGFKRVLIVFA